MNQSNIRPPAVAGLFYPGNPQKLKNVLQDFFDHAAKPDSEMKPCALIAPHAGVVYSGIVAAAAYSLLQDHDWGFRRYVLLGPAHRVFVEGLVLSPASFFETPLGKVPLDIDQAEYLSEKYSFIRYNKSAHREEHSLEVQLPFLQYAADDFEILPILAGHCTAEDAAACIREYLCVPDTLIVVSSDLSHFLPYTSAQKIDQETAEAVAALDFQALGHDSACGRIPISGLLLAAQKQKLRSELLSLCNSGDTAGTREQVVGYGAWGFFKE